jgi:hypothetical protein
MSNLKWNLDSDIDGVYKKLVDMLNKTLQNTNAELEAKKDELAFTQKDDKYYIGEKELDPNKLEEWGSILISEMAKKLMNDQR